MRHNTPISNVFYGRIRVPVRPPCRLHASLALVAVFAAIGCNSNLLFVRGTHRPSIDSAPQALAAIRESTDPVLRRAAFAYLGNPRNLGEDTGNREEMTGILGLALSAETHAETRIVILQSIGRLESSNRRVAIAPALSDSEPSVRVAACRALGQLEDSEIVSMVAPLLASDTSLDVRLAAADALGRVRSREAALAVLGGTEDGDVAVRFRCRQSFRLITGTDYTPGRASELREEIQAAQFEPNGSRIPSIRWPWTL